MPPNKHILEDSDMVSTPPLNKRTRYGRVVKKPVRYEPDEKVEDDFTENDYDEDVDISDCESILPDVSDAESSSSDDDSDADENGNLKDFITYSDSENEIEDDSESGEDSASDSDDSEYSE